MACIQRLNKAIAFGCTGGLAGVEALYLVNKDDIISLSRGSNGAVTDIALSDYPGDADNLYVNGREELSTPDYEIGREYYGDKVKKYGVNYTLTACYTLGSRNTHMFVMQSGGSYSIGDLRKTGARSIESKTFIPVASDADWGKPFGGGIVYQAPIGTHGSVLHWAVLTEGSAAAVAPHSIPVDCHRNGVKLIDTLRTSDVGDRLEQTLSITLYDKADTETLTKLVNGSFVAFVKMKELGAIYAVGINNGLTIASADMDSSANGGFTSITLKTPEGCIGEQRVLCTKTAWDKVITLSI